jgi:class 3 adenylate cyclase
MPASPIRTSAGCRCFSIWNEPERPCYGNTVNVAARIGEFARPGEVLVSQEVVDLVNVGSLVEFIEVGAVELKGVLEPMVLHAASPM